MGLAVADRNRPPQPDRRSGPADSMTAWSSKWLRTPVGRPVPTVTAALPDAYIDAMRDAAGWNPNRVSAPGPVRARAAAWGTAMVGRAV